jgi:hypothetical protein
VRNWLITGLVILIILVLIGVAYDQGLFDNLRGTGIAVIITALAAPYMAIKNWLFGNKLQQQFKAKYDAMAEQEKVHRVDYDQQIALKQKRIADMDKEIQLLDAKLEVLELKKKKIEQDVKSMTIEDKKREVQNLFGD